MVAPLLLFAYTRGMNIVEIITGALQGVLDLIGQAFGLVAQFFNLLGSIVQQIGGLFGG